MLLWQHSSQYMVDFATTQSCLVVMSVNKKEFLPNWAAFDGRCFASLTESHCQVLTSLVVLPQQRERWRQMDLERWKTLDRWIRYSWRCSVFARDVEDGRVKCFIVRKGAPGYSRWANSHKVALSLRTYGHITMKNRQFQIDRLKHHRFADVARISDIYSCWRCSHCNCNHLWFICCSSFF